MCVRMLRCQIAFHGSLSGAIPPQKVGLKTPRLTRCMRKLGLANTYIYVLVYLFRFPVKGADAGVRALIPII